MVPFSSPVSLSSWTSIKILMMFYSKCIITPLCVLKNCGFVMEPSKRKNFYFENGKLANQKCGWNKGGDRENSGGTPPRPKKARTCSVTWWAVGPTWTTQSQLKNPGTSAENQVGVFVLQIIPKDMALVPKTKTLVPKHKSLVPKDKCFFQNVTTGHLIGQVQN